MLELVPFPTLVLLSWFVVTHRKSDRVPASGRLFWSTDGTRTSSVLAMQPLTESGLGCLRMRENIILRFR